MQESLTPSQETILVIDDEAAVRGVARSMLERLGFQVEMAPDGMTGLDRIRNGPTQIDAVLIDLTMPGMSGDAVVREVRREWPQLPLVLMSGYSATEIAQEYADLQIDGILQKPFTLATLRAALNDMRARRVTSSSNVMPAEPHWNVRHSHNHPR
jgi:two-component system, cell cycle sensor histidine kinase and response regulator CckA